MAGSLEDEPLLNIVSVVSMIATMLMAVLSGLFVKVCCKNASSVDRFVLFWLTWDAVIHFTVEGPFVWFSLTGTVKDSNNPLALLWKEYGKADSRWLISDPTIVSLELLTVAFDGPLCLLLIWAICREKNSRHFLQIILCVCELYGGWMTFVPDVLAGSPSLATNKWLYFWIYLVFYNGIWVVVPLLLLYQSWLAMTSDQLQPSRSVESPGGSRKYNLRSKKSE